MRPQAIVKVLATVLSVAEAASFSAWNTRSCRRIDAHSVKADRVAAAPFTCYYVGSSSSIKVMNLGTQGKFELFSDVRCGILVGTVSQNDVCVDKDFLSLAFIPNPNHRTELMPPSDPYENELQELKLKVDERMPMHETMSSWWPHSSSHVRDETTREPGSQNHEAGGFEAVYGSSFVGQITGAAIHAHQIPSLLSALGK